MTKKLIIIGGEGNGGVVAACVEDINKILKEPAYEIVGFLNDYHADKICGILLSEKLKPPRNGQRKAIS